MEDTSRTRPLRATLLLIGCLVLAGLLTWRAARQTPGQSLEADAPVIVPLLADNAPLPRDEFALTWDGPENAEYHVEVLLENGTQLLVAEGVGRTQIVVPEAAIGTLPGGTRIYWTVTTQVDGTEISSGVQTAELR